MGMSSEKTTPNDKLLSVKDVAQKLAVRTAKVYEMAKSGDGPPSVRIGKLIKFRPQAVEQWLKDQER